MAWPGCAGCRRAGRCCARPRRDRCMFPSRRHRHLYRRHPRERAHHVELRPGLPLLPEFLFKNARPLVAVLAQEPHERTHLQPDENGEGHQHQAHVPCRRPEELEQVARFGNAEDIAAEYKADLTP